MHPHRLPTASTTTPTYSYCLDKNERDHENTTDLFVQENLYAGGKTICEFLKEKGHQECNIVFVSRLSKSLREEFVFVVSVSLSELRIIVFERSYALYPLSGDAMWMLKSDVIPFSIDDLTDQVVLDSSLTSQSLESHFLKYPHGILSG